MNKFKTGNKFEYPYDKYGFQYYEITDTQIEKHTYFDTDFFIPCNHVCEGKTKATSFIRPVHGKSLFDFLKPIEA